MNDLKKITGGIYLVIDPAWELSFTLPRLEQALKAGISTVQIWDHWLPDTSKEGYIEAITALAHEYEVPVFINHHWELLKNSHLDGVHFDAPPSHLPLIQKEIARPFLKGITCGNDLSTVHWATQQGFDYVSFCSMFPTSAADSCEIVQPATVIQARASTPLPIFVAGGISLGNIDSLIPCGIDGVALISGIMKSDDPFKTTIQFKNHFLNHESNAHS
ncbi:thiamine phosphate synthase [Runella sp. MFBS21]|uniref:thiamine phosphate synthase n=1 Tax=Runella sp. MFBS21 TaxID=3034018 RepID=UPI0023F7795B|nr:thiamine phosphate synthase [Runella sp. MFBS21]MDF7817035.1 thiamine phosphate synthase [Runella sp. MFBS21]